MAAVFMAAFLTLAAAMVFSASRTAEDYRRGTSYVEERGGVYGTTATRPIA
jgi:hypothetical protein